MGNRIKMVLIGSLVFLFSGCFGGGPSLATLADSGQYNEVKELIDKGTNVNEVQDGWSLLLRAAQSGNIELMKYLIEKGANINYIHPVYNVSPLYQFISVGYAKNSSSKSLEMVKWMIENGADYKHIGHNNNTLIHASDDIALTKYLIELGMDIKSLTKNNATTLLVSLIRDLNGQQETTEIQEYLINNCVDLKQLISVNGMNFDALTIAKEFNRLKAAKLIENALKNPPIQCQSNGGILAPKISFYNLPQTFDSEVSNISVQVEAQGFGIGDIVLKVNGAEISINQDRGLKMPKDGLKIKSFTIKLQNGLNEIRAYAYDEKNKVKSTEIFTDVVAEYKVNTLPQLHVIALGIDEFQDKSLNLKYAEADASLFGTTIFKRSKDLFSKVNIEYMKKADYTTKDAILKKLAEMKNISANDYFVFYSATHGMNVDNKYYMITSNISSTDAQEIKRNAISEDDLREAFRQIPTANKLLLFDTCYSGSINDSISKQLAKSTTGKLNLTSMTAANSVQTALEGFADGHGIFTYVLSEALEGDADINKDGIIQSMELVNFANKMVPLEAKKYKHTQTPAYFQSGQIFNISKMKNFIGEVDMKPQYFKPEQVEKLVTYMEKNDVKALNTLLVEKKTETKKLETKIKSEAAKIEAKNAAETFKNADKKFKFGKYNFIFNDNSIFLDIKDKVKQIFPLVDSKGRNLIVFDFYSNDDIPRVVSSLDTEKVSDIYSFDHGDWYRVTLQTKSEQSYELFSNEDGTYIKLKNK